MWLEAILSKEDLLKATHQLTPLTIALGKGGGALFLDEPTVVELVPDKGLRVVCRARVTWPVLGIHVPITILSADVLVEPTIERTDGVEALVFKLQIVHADLAHVPTFVDDKITDLVNAELLAQRVELSWKFTESLRTLVDLPAIFDPHQKLTLRALGGMVRMTPDALGLAVTLRSDFSRGNIVTDEELKIEGTASPPAPPAPSQSLAKRASRRAPWPLLALTGLVALGVGFASARIFRGRA